MKRKLTLLFTIAPLMILLDQITKRWAINTLKGKPPVEVIENFFHFRYVENRGAAWGMFGSLSTTYRVPFFVVLTIIAMLILLKIYKDLRGDQLLSQISLSMIVGGAIGNFIDRVFVTRVVDFIDWHYYSKHWPTFNIADVAITGGVALLFIAMMIEPKAKKENPESETPIAE